MKTSIFFNNPAKEPASKLTFLAFVSLLIATFLLSSCGSAATTPAAGSSPYRLDITPVINNQHETYPTSLTTSGTTERVPACVANYFLDEASAQLYVDGELLAEDTNATPSITITTELDTTDPLFTNVVLNEPGTYTLNYIVTLTEGTASPRVIEFPVDIIVANCTRELRITHASTDFETDPLSIPIAGSATPPSLSVTDVCIDYAPVLTYFENGVEIENKTITPPSSIPEIITGLTNEPISYTIEDVFGVPQTYTFNLSSVVCPANLRFVLDDGTRSSTLNITQNQTDYFIPNCFSGTSLPTSTSTPPPTYSIEGSRDIASVTINPPSDVSINPASTINPVSLDGTEAYYTYEVVLSSGETDTFNFTLKKEGEDGEAGICERELVIQVSDEVSLSIPYVSFDLLGATENVPAKTLSIPQCYPFTPFLDKDNPTLTNGLPFTNGLLYYEDGELIPEGNDIILPDGSTLRGRGFSRSTPFPNHLLTNYSRPHPEHGRVFSSTIIGETRISSDLSNFQITLDDIFHPTGGVSSTGKPIFESLTFEFILSVQSCEPELYITVASQSTASSSASPVIPTDYTTATALTPATNVDGKDYYLLSLTEENTPVFTLDDCSVFSATLLTAFSGQELKEPANSVFSLASTSTYASGNSDTLLNLYYSPSYYTNGDSGSQINAITNTLTFGTNTEDPPFRVNLGGECTVSNFAATGSATPGSTNAPYGISNASLLYLTSYLIDIDYSTYSNSNFLVTADIDMEIPGALWSSNIGGEGFPPIATDTNLGFRGVFDCGYTGTDGTTSNYTISNLYISKSPVFNNLGLFGKIEGSSPSGNASGASLKNCNLEGVNITGGNIIGAFAGSITNTNSENLNLIGANNNITGRSNIGGLFGQANNSTLTNAEINATISGTGNIGGVMGAGVSLTALTHVSMKGSVSGNTQVGGIVGDAVNIRLTNITSSATVTATSSSPSEFGGAIGRFRYGTNSPISNVYISGDVLASSANNVGGIIGYMPANSSLITLEECGFSGNLQGANHVGGIIGHYSSESNEPANIGNSINISNCVALGSSDAMITGSRNNVGGLIGFYNQTSTTLTNGIGSISHSYSTYDIVGANNVGGLMGTMRDATTAKSINIINSYALGNVTGTENVGGLVGEVLHYFSIDNAYAGGDVTGRTNVGGIVGNADLAINLTNSYASGTVSAGVAGSTDGENVGGFFGSLTAGTTSNATLSNSYVSTTLSNLGTADISSLTASWGGVAGSLTDVLDYPNSYFDSSLSVLTNAFGFVPPDVEDTTGSTTTTLLQTPIASGVTGDVYELWTDTCTPAGGTADVSTWDFGTDSDYPVLSCLSGVGGLTPDLQRMPTADQRTAIQTATLTSIPALDRTQ